MSFFRTPSAYIVAATVFATVTSCGRRAETPPSAPAAGSAGTGGGSGTGVAGAPASAGQAGGTNVGGIGGASPSAGAAGEQPLTWEPIGDPSDPCPIQRVANRGVSKAFDWTPYPGLAGIEKTRWTNIGFADNGTNNGILPSAVEETDAGVRIALSIFGPNDGMLLLTTDDGLILDGFRTPAVDMKCLVAPASLWNGRVAFASIPRDPSSTSRYNCVVDPSDLSVPATFSIPVMPGGAQQFALGESRWVWWWTGNRMMSVTTADGTWQNLAAPSSTLAVGYPASAGNLFFFDLSGEGSGGSVFDYVGMSDGSTAITPLLGASGDGYSYGTARWAHTYVTWRRAQGYQDVNKYQSVELWASPATTDPSALQPFMVGKLQGWNIVLPSVAGYGALATPIEETGANGVVLWDLAARTSSRYDVPSDDHVNNLIGMTKAHAYALIAAKLSNRPTTVMRFARNHP